MNSTYHERFSIKIVAMSIRLIILIFVLSFVSSPASYGEDPFFSIALSKFSKEKDAVKEETKLKNSGHNAFYRKEKNPDNKSIEYQVYIEKYNTMDEAEKEAMVLKDLELISDYSVREVREASETLPKQSTPPKGKNTKVSPKPQPKEVKKQPLKSSPVSQQQTTAPEPSPAINKSEAASPETKPKTEPPLKENKPKAEPPSQSVEKAKTKTESPDPVEKVRSDTELQPAKNKTEQKPVPKPEQKPEPKKKIVKPEPVINHDDARLIGASLQVGSFKDEANAATLKMKLKTLGKNAFYRFESTDNKGKFYRLYITGYSSLREAIKDAEELVGSGVISSYSRVIGKDTDPVSSTTSESADAGDKIYLIHVSSNKDEKNAAENVARLKENGYKAIYILEKDQSTSWYRVYIGKFKNETEAREKGKELFERGLIKYFKPIAIDRKKLND